MDDVGRKLDVEETESTLICNTDLLSFPKFRTLLSLCSLCISENTDVMSVDADAHVY